MVSLAAQKCHKNYKRTIDKAWASADDETKTHCKETAQEWIESGPYLISEIQKGLQVANSAVLWKKLATNVAGAGNLQPLSEWSIRTFVMGLPDSCYKTTRILPKLDKANILR